MLYYSALGGRSQTICFDFHPEQFGEKIAGIS